MTTMWMSTVTQKEDINIACCGVYTQILDEFVYVILVTQCKCVFTDSWHLRITYLLFITFLVESLNCAGNTLQQRKHLVL